MQGIYIGTLSLYEVFAYFYIYAFLGWVTEVVFHAITQGKFVNRGFLNGPVCPIYGVGVLVILLILGDYKSNFWLTFLVGVLLPSAIELVTGWLLEKLFHNKWWDYSDRKFNFKGYICLEFSLLWGVAVLFVVFGVHPLAEWFAGLFSETAGMVIVIAFTVIFIVDIVLTVLQVLKLNKKLKELDALSKAIRSGGDLLGKPVAAAAIAVSGAVVSAKEKAEEKTATAHEKWNESREKMQKRVDELIEKTPKRLLKAFPHLQSKRSPEGVATLKQRLLKGKEKDSGKEKKDK